MSASHWPGGGRLGPFRLTAELGRGGFKVVYKAENAEPERNRYPKEVALCVPHCQDEEARTLLRRECQIGAALEHPGIVRQYGVEEAEGVAFAVSELVEGETLAARLRRQGPLPLAAAVELARQVGAALDYAHDGMAIHRDIKPANIMLMPVGGQEADGAPPVRAKILDFGLARLMAHSQYKAMSRVGTVAYMAPEQFEGATGFNADLWGLGVTFYQTIVNTLPFPVTDEGRLMKAILYEAPDLGPVEQGDFDPGLANVLRKVFEKDPEKRYRRAADFVADLEAVLRHATAVNRVDAQLEVYFRAHFPLIYIQSFEEERVRASLRRIRDALALDADKLGREVGYCEWSATLGLRDRDGRPVAPGTAGDPVAALNHVAAGGSAGMYVFLDIHRHLTPVTIRLIRDACWSVRRGNRYLVFVSPVVSLPEDLVADVTLFHYDPPDMNGMRERVEAVAQEEPAAGRAPDQALRDELARAALGLTGEEAGRAVRRAALRRGALTRQCLPDVIGEKRQIVRKGGVLEFYETDVSFAQVGGLEALKQWFEGRRQAFSETGRRFGLPMPRGAVLVGVPGCGKSLSAKALAKDWGVPLLRLDMGRVYASLVGQAEANLRQALATAELTSPCVLWIDELEKAFGGLRQARDSGVTQRLFGAFLTWLGDRRGPVFVVATANDVTRLPVEFTRKGRFDEIFFVDLPGETERQAIFRVQLPQFGRDPGKLGLDLPRLAKASEGFSGAEIREVIVAGLGEAFHDNARGLRLEDLEEEMRRTVPLSRTRAADIARMRAWAGENAKPAS